MPNFQVGAEVPGDEDSTEEDSDMADVMDFFL